MGNTNAIIQSALTRTLANVFLFLLITAALVVVSIEILTGQTINGLAQNVLTIGAGYALTLAAINHGVTLQNVKLPDASPAESAGPEVKKVDTP